MIKFNDSKNWLDERIAHIPKSYYVPEVFNGNGICIDIGSNVGAFSIVYNDRFKKIYCYEPAEYTYNECKKKISNYDNVEINKFAISNVSGNRIKLKSHKDSNFSGNASVIDSPEWNDNENYEYVETKSLQDIIMECEITNKKKYVKIDTEGTSTVN